MNKQRRNQLKEWSKRFEALRLELQIFGEDERESGWTVIAEQLDIIENDLTALRGRVDEIVNQ